MIIFMCGVVWLWSSAVWLRHAEKSGRLFYLIWSLVYAILGGLLIGTGAGIKW
uniref:Uncharacterized protein n=1 Tax=viral metagenome TaxID=1070528 RepID=A0A6M3KAA5_9ZZZZ